MAQWSDYIALFSPEEQAVISELENKATDNFGYSDFEEFRLGVESNLITYLQPLDATDAFVQALTVWIKGVAQNANVWSDFPGLFPAHDMTYLNLFIAAHDGVGMQPGDLDAETVEDTAQRMIDYPGFWDAYVQAHSYYLQDLDQYFSISITAQPEGGEVDWDQHFSLDVSATSNAPLTYQWRKNGVPISGATAETFQLLNIQSTDAGEYDCVVSTGGAEEISAKAVIQVSSFSSEIQTVRGLVVNGKGAPQVGVIVKLFDRKPGVSKEIGSTVTDASGHYRLEYLKSVLIDQVSFIANLKVQLFEPSGTEPKLSSELIEGASAIEEINFETNVFASTQTEYAATDAYITGALDSGTLLIDLSEEDIALLANQSFSEEIIKAYVQADALSQALAAVSREHFFGLIRLGFPPNIVEITNSKRVPLRDALIEASSKQIIGFTDETAAANIAVAITDEGTNFFVDSEVNPFISAFDQTSLTSTQKTNIIDALLTNTDGTADFWQGVIDDTENEVSESDVNEIRRILEVRQVDENNNHLVAVLDANVGDPATPTTLSDLAKLKVSDWEAMIDDSDDNLLRIPRRFTDTEAENKTAYAKELRAKVEIMLPTAVLASDMKEDTSFVSTDFEEFFAVHPDFEFSKDQVATYLESNPLNPADFTNTVEEVQSKLESVQRLFRLTPSINRFESVKPLMEANVTSASKIARMGKSAFINQFGDTLGAETSKLVFDNASTTYGKVIHIATKYKSGAGPLVLGSTTYAGSDPVSGLPDLETLFGSLDYCSCTHCRSVYSPAAYMVDLLNFLDHEPVDENNNSIGVNLKDDFLSRRPEVGKLLLNCENSNTPLPYIDIVNEILENYIATTADEFYQTEDDAETLRATAQNVIESVYDVDLKNANYPYQLPFNLWFEQSREYLRKSAVDLGALIVASPEGALSVDRQKAIAAAASLGISIQQLDIINGSSSATAAELFNVSNINLLNPVEQLVKKADITFEELKELLDVKFINPLRKTIYYPTNGSCDLQLLNIGDNPSDASPDPLSGLSETELIDLNRFARLKALTAWSAKDLDLVINQIGSGNLDDQMIVQIDQINKLKNRFSIEIEEMVLWWDDFEIATYIDEVIFDKLFQDNSVNHRPGGIPVFSSIGSFTGHTFDEPEIKPLVLGAFNLSATDLEVVLAEGDISNSVTNESLSYLYRLSAFSRASGMEIADYYQLRALVNLDAIKVSAVIKPEDTISFLDAVDLLEASAFTNEEIAYLKSGDDTNSLAPTDDQIITLLTAIRKDYQNANIQFPLEYTDLETEIDDLIDDYVPNRSGLDDMIDGTVSVSASEIYLQQALENIVRQSEFDALFMDLTFASNGIGKKAVMFNYLKRFDFLQKDFKTATIERLAIFYNISVDLTAELFSLDSTVSGENFSTSVLDLDFLISVPESNPNAALYAITTDNYQDKFNILRVASKVATITKGLDTNPIELAYLINTVPVTELSLAHLPVNGTTDHQFSNIKILLEISDLSSKWFQSDQSLIEFMAAQTANRFGQLAKATGWNENDISTLCGVAAFNFEANIADYQKIGWIQRLAELIPLMLRANLDAASLVGLDLTDPDSETAFSLRNLLSSGKSKKQWAELASEIHDKIRERQRDALVTFMIANYADFSSIEEIYNHFLIDSQMNSCQLTSRIKQATSALQLFIQRIGLGYESGLILNADKMDEWGWRKNYRVWEANRKVFLYPENYLLPELRLTQSKLYEEFEQALTQENLSSQLAEDAFEKYLTGFKNVADIEINQICYDDDSGTLHLIGNNQQDPKQYFYRKLEDNSIWSAWEEIPLDFSGSVLPLMYRGKLMVVWLDTKLSKEAPDSSQLQIDTANTVFSVDSSVAEGQTDIRLAWTFKGSAGWEPKRLSLDIITVDDFRPEHLVMIPMFKSEHALFISLNKYNYFPGGDPKDLVPFWAFKYGLGGFKALDIDDEQNSDSLYVNHTQMKGEIINRKPSNHLYFPDFQIYSVGVHYESHQASGNDPAYDALYNDFSALEKRNINFGALSNVTYGGSNRGTYVNQKLEVNGITSLKNVHELIVDHISPQYDRNYNNFGLLNRAELGFKHLPLLSSFTRRSMTITREIARDFPFLSTKGLVGNQDEQSPFFIQDGNRIFIVQIRPFPYDPRRVTFSESFIEIFPSDRGAANSVGGTGIVTRLGAGREIFREDILPDFL